MAPTSPEKTTPSVSASGWTTSLAIVAATLVPKIRNATKLKNAAHSDGQPGASTACGDHGGDGVGRVVEAVEEVEGERDRDDDDQPGGDHGSGVLQDDGLQHVRHVLAAVDRALQRSTMSFHFSTSMAL